MLRFIHCSDLHIDSPFSGMRSVSSDAAAELYHATFDAFRNIVDMAIDEEVDFVAISGDAFNSREKSLYSWLRFQEQLLRLNENDIKCFYCCGNHDPLDTSTKHFTMPDNCHRFGAGSVEKVRVEKNGVILADIYGISFDRSTVTENLSLKFQRDDITVPAIALLHCNIGSTGHEAYAPAAVDDLCEAGMDYWALGHVHSFHILREASPTVVYSGCPQGCSPRETGVHGCCLVSIDDKRNIEVDFRPVDVIRFKELEVVVNQYNDIVDVVSSVVTAIEDSMSSSEERGGVFRVILTGKTSLDREFRKSGVPGDILDEVRGRLKYSNAFAWIDRISIETTGDYDVEELKLGNDFTSELIALYDDVMDSDGLEEYLSGELESAFKRWRGSGCLEELSIEDCRKICTEARDMTLNRIIGGGV